MNLLYTATAYPPSVGGAQLHHHNLAMNMSKHHQVKVVAFWDNNRTDWLKGTTLNAPTSAYHYQQDNIPVHLLGLSFLEKLKIAPLVALYYPMMPLALPPLAALLREKIEIYAGQVDLIHNARIGREPLSCASLQLARQKDIPFVFTPFHHPRWVGWRYKAYIDIYKQADAVLALTASEKQILMDLGVKEERIAVIGMGPMLAVGGNPGAFEEKYKIEAPFVLFVGQHYPYKGYRQLLEAAPLVWQQIPEAHFVFIGPQVGDSERYFDNYTDGRIHCLGKVSLEDKTNALAACYLLCLPSIQESFGGVYTEAWSYAKPVIGCPIPAVSEVIDDGVNGFLVEQEPAAIAERIIYFLLNPGIAEQMGKSGQEKVEQRYSWEKLASQARLVYEALYEGHSLG